MRHSRHASPQGSPQHARGSRAHRARSNRVHHARSKRAHRAKAVVRTVPEAVVRAALMQRSAGKLGTTFRLHRMRGSGKVAAWGVGSTESERATRSSMRSRMSALLRCTHKQSMGMGTGAQVSRRALVFIESGTGEQGDAHTRASIAARTQG